MLLAVKNPAWLLAFLMIPCVAAGQSPSPGRVGVCVDADRFEAAKAAGFDYLEVNASRVAALTDAEFQQLEQRVAGLGIPVAAANVFLPGSIKLTGPDVDPARQMAYVTAAMARLKRLGVKIQVLGSGGARRVPDGFSHEEAFKQLVDFCRRLAPVAREHGITIAFEPLRRQETNIVNTVREGLALVKAVDRPEIKLVVDFYHLAEERESPDILLEAGALVAHTHIANPAGRVYPLIASEADYGPYFRNLCKIGYSGRMSVEASTKDFASDAPQSVALIRQALACASR